MPLTPTPGSDAVLAGMTLVPGAGLAADLEEYINRVADYLANGHTYWKPGILLPVTRGGHGGSTAAQARTNLAAPWDAVGASGAPGGLKFTSPGFDRISLEAPGIAFPHTLAYLTDIPGAPDLSSRVAKSGDTMSGNLDVPNLGVSGSIFNSGMSSVVSGYVAVYRDASGRIGLSPSTRRAKKEIKAWAPNLQALLAIQVVTFRYRAELFDKTDPLRRDAPIEVGLIAEDLDALGLTWLVYYDAEGLPAGVHYEKLALALLPIVQDHEARLTEAEVGLDGVLARLDTLEGARA
ncbi:tail fiber domain-containing protein [Microbacterium rhizomatis]|uniref:Tail fiber domain-containing protein n=1 Tax=Microbacterium rhizomatis TaxID=1631477 RepID=A0A5J5IY58_9MICO|nr:tail fiber domain-containing protein [Microbacterium rhizomatis]KAA9105002.1 tail fiber domain-containing protein [Microbacterium rhizomatis]